VIGRVLGVHAVALPGACVTAVGRSGSFTGVARNNGRFVISGLPTGRYSLEYRDCAAPGRYFAQRSGGAALPGSASQIDVTAGRVLALPPVTLRPTDPMALLPAKRPLLRHPAGARGLPASTSGHISGVVTDTASHPVKGICVLAFPIDGGSAFAVGTSTTGAYTTGPLAAGTYAVQFSAGCNNQGNWLPQTYKNETAEFSSQPPTPVTVTAGQTTTGIDAAMLLGGAISGTVTSLAGRTLPGICVLAFQQTKHTFTEIETSTGRHGRYDLGRLFPGKYRVQFSTGCGNHGNYAQLWWPKAATLRKAGFVQVTLGQVDSGIDAALRPGAEISGTVRFASRGGKPGRPLRGICVDAQGLGAARNVAVQAATGRGGRYLVKGLSTGRYQVQFFAGCGNNGNFVASAHRHPVRAAAGHVTKGVNGVLHRGGKISGVVRDVHGKRLAGICLQLQGGGGLGAGPGETNERGSFAFTQLPAGTYTLAFSGGCSNPGNFAPQWYHGETDAFAADPDQDPRRPGPSRDQRGDAAGRHRVRPHY
jgi:hypothetical protein